MLAIDDKNQSMWTLQSPYLDDGYTWLKGNLHTHTTMSDGEFTPQQVIARYEGLGYDFLALSDHDTLTPPEAYQPGTRLVLLSGVEVSANGPHLLQIGPGPAVAPSPDRHQVVRDIVQRGGIAIMNHPNWEWSFNHFPQELMEELDGTAGLEIYNGVIERLEGAALATDRWDRLLSRGRRLWGYADDDLHCSADLGIACNVVQATARAPEAVLDALRAGRSYASTGVAIQSASVEGATLTVRAAGAQRIRFVTRWGAIQHSVDGPEARWSVPASADARDRLMYVRAECYGAGGRAAWTQPFWIQ